MTTPTLKERLAHLVESAEESWVAVTYPARQAPAALAIVGSMRPLRRYGGQAASEQAARYLASMPPGYVDIYLQRKVDERREAGVLAEAARRDVDVTTFDSDHLDHLASWGYAQLDPPHDGEAPVYSEGEARLVALAALKHEGLAVPLVGEHLLFCRYSYKATRHQPVWLGLFEVHDEEHLIVINADSDRLLQPI